MAATVLSRRYFSVCFIGRPALTNITCMKLSMKLSNGRVWFVVLNLIFFLGQPVTAMGEPLTLDTALEMAARNNPTLQRTRAQIFSVQGELDDAYPLLWNNPQVALERRRSIEALGEQNHDGGIGFSQTFELGGQQRIRRTAAAANQRAVAEEIEAARRSVLVAVAQQFILILSLSEQLELEEAQMEILRVTSEAVGARVEAGETGLIEGNLATIEADRAGNQLAETNEQLIRARATLASLLQVSLTEITELSGSLEMPVDSRSLEELQKSTDDHPLFKSVVAQEEAARSRLQLERRARVPDLTVQLGYSTENTAVGGGSDRITTLDISFPLPLFHRNDTGVGQAMTALAQVEIDRESTRQTLEASVLELWLRLQSLRQRSAQLQSAVLPRLEQNQSLAMRALEEGEISLTEFLLVRRQVLDGQQDLIEAHTGFQLSCIELESIVGSLGTPDVPDAQDNQERFRCMQ